jgi:hypothetical protein
MSSATRPIPSRPASASPWRSRPSRRLPRARRTHPSQGASPHRFVGLEIDASVDVHHGDPDLCRAGRVGVVTSAVRSPVLGKARRAGPQWTSRMRPSAPRRGGQARRTAEAPARSGRAPVHYDPQEDATSILTRDPGAQTARPTRLPNFIAPVVKKTFSWVKKHVDLWSGCVSLSLQRSGESSGAAGSRKLARKGPERPPGTDRTTGEVA